MGEWVEVTRAKAKAMRAQRRKAAQEQSRNDKLVAKEAALAAVDKHCKDESAALEIIDETCIPFPIDKTHQDVIEIGGFIGCRRCGRIASVANKKNRLAQPCRGFCPAGTKGATDRMAKGKHPQRSAGTSWPDGRIEPRPRRVCLA